MKRLSLVILGFAVAACSPTIVKQEPEGGTLPHNEVMLVDDSSCPAGQIKEITGGNNELGIDRKSRCIPRP